MSNDAIRDAVYDFLETERLKAPDVLANLLTLNFVNGPRRVAEVKTEWEWSPPGFSRPRGLYRADVAALDERGVPLLVVEVDVTTPGKAAVGAMLMADLALREREGRVACYRSLYWFQVVTTADAKPGYQDRLAYVYREVFRRAEYRADEPEYVENENCTLCLGREPLVDTDVTNFAAWQRVKPKAIGRVPETF